MDSLFSLVYFTLAWPGKLVFLSLPSSIQDTALDRALWVVPAPPQLATFQTSTALSCAAQHTSKFRSFSVAKIDESTWNPTPPLKSLNMTWKQYFKNISLKD